MEKEMNNNLIDNEADALTEEQLGDVAGGGRVTGRTYYSKCPRCHSTDIVHSFLPYHHYRCKSCGHEFT